MLLIGAASSLITPMVYCDGYRLSVMVTQLENDVVTRGR